MRNVTIVVAVLTTSCQDSEKPKMGPVSAQTTISETAMMNAVEWPDCLAMKSANRPKTSLSFIWASGILHAQENAQRFPHVARKTAAGIQRSRESVRR